MLREVGSVKKNGIEDAERESKYSKSVDLSDENEKDLVWSKNGVPET